MSVNDFGETANGDTAMTKLLSVNIPQAIERITRTELRTVAMHKDASGQRKDGYGEIRISEEDA